MRPAGLAIVALALALAGLPPAQAAASAPVGSTPTTLYMHLLGHQDFPVNTQRPDYGFQQLPAAGLATHTLDCLPDPPAGGSPFQGYHSWYGYSTPTYVEYGSMENGRPRTNPWRGLSWDVPLDPGVQPTLHWYLETQGSTAPGMEAVPVPLANVVVQATLRAPDFISADDLGYDTGPVIAHGRSEPALLAGDATQGAEHAVAGGRHVYGFAVPLAYDAPLIPRETGYVLRIDAYIDNPACDPESERVMAAQAVPFSDEEHEPRIELAASDVLRIDALDVAFIEDAVVVQAIANSAWGSYDVDESNLTLAIEGPDGPVEAPVVAVVQETHAWGHFTEPVRATWALDRTGATPGAYHATLTVRNDQGAATAVAHAAFTLGPDRAYAAPEGGGVPDVPEPMQAMPAAGLPLLAAGLAAAAAVLAARRVP